MNNQIQVWKKIGLIHCPDGKSEELKSHASVPFMSEVRNGINTIFFSSRDNSNKSVLASIDINLDTLKTSNLTPTPLLKGGKIGSFDEDGVMGCGFFKTETETYLTYIGWNLGKSVPFRNSIGLARFAKQKFEKVFEGPILDRSPYDPYFVASNCVVRMEGKYLMYYLSCTKWSNLNNQLSHFYNIKIAESKDGIVWLPINKVAIDFKNEYENAISVPRVIYENNSYKMWYSYRADAQHKTYRIGYAESFDGYNWIRKDNLVQLDVSASGWDSEMICYPFVFDYSGNRYMLYNGNGYGKTGFGIAILEHG